MDKVIGFEKLQKSRENDIFFTRACEHLELKMKIRNGFALLKPSTTEWFAYRRRT